MRIEEPRGEQPGPNAVKAETSENVSADMQPLQLANVSAGLTFVNLGYQFEFGAQATNTLPALRAAGFNPDGYPGEEWIWESESCASDNFDNNLSDAQTI